MIVLGVMGALMTVGAVHEWTPGDRFDTLMMLIMLAWMLYFTTWAVQLVRHRPVRARRPSPVS